MLSGRFSHFLLAYCTNVQYVSPRIMKELTDEQQKVFGFILKCKREDGAPPTVREIAEEFGYKSPNNASQHLRLIESKGYIRRTPGRSRGIEILIDTPEEATPDKRLYVPLVGEIAAGSPITAIENIEDHIALDSNIFRGEKLFSLRVRGDSMQDAGILNGDLAIIKQQPVVDNGDIAAVIIEGEATLKRYIKENNQIRLRAENPAYDDIIVQSDRDVHIAGKLSGVLRKC